ncbi:hypothetical protein L202_02573 [Cryptococcus amylolentus CBS 6039]|uniref:Major facilitator superfamily (MFS) profile domain-containing protein n=1 Tax=Cryptococcus amylolentus CBS 6039 TaxID=1295533 RepID=A0A1E3I1Q9_9TREE|nr:hypothetical protein L202_02573 [Cryptococcus amylolentus CBS 6039]ODN82295.1 hypothetical protein L202_02573 [Cryptococcus amylolentus CBS 6039]
MSPPHSPKSVQTETSALLPTPPLPANRSLNTPSWYSPIRRVLFTSLLLAMTFRLTQTTVIYAFRVMTCDEYYKSHDWVGERGDDKCSLPKIEAESASHVALMSMMTTMGTIGNLFYATWFIKRHGCKATVFQQTLWIALRNLADIYAINTGGSRGIRIIQASQLLNFLGSPGGIQIACNMYIAILAKAEDRTAKFGVLTGIVFLGSSIGFSAGGLLFFPWLGLIGPFYAAFGFLCFTTLTGSLFLPNIPPEDSQDRDVKKKKRSFLSPLKIFIPTKHLVRGAAKRDYNLLWLGLGAFFSVLATGYVHIGLQLVGTSVFRFLPGQNSIMLSLNLMVKALFLSICFPRIIKHGRRWVSRRPTLSAPPPRYYHPEEASQVEEPDPASFPQRDLPASPADKPHGSIFDLHFLRWSIFVDGVLTALTAFSTNNWHLYLAAGVLPFASATGSACKGVMMDLLVDPEQRTDALSAIALVEKLAQVSTISVFGFVFAALSERGHPALVFFINGCTAMVAFMFTLFVQMRTTGKCT